MADGLPTLCMSPQAEDELRKHTEMVYRSVELGIIDEDFGWYEIERKTVELMREATRPVGDNGERNIATCCPDCKRVHVMPASVPFYTCSCSNVERPTWKHSVDVADARSGRPLDTLGYVIRDPIHGRQ